MEQPSMFLVPPSHIDKAWKDGAHMLSEAAEKAAGEVTTDQLKMLLSRGERRLIGVRDLATPDALPGAWAAISVHQMPNLRALYVYALWAPGVTGPKVMEQLRAYASSEGCSVIRGSCGDGVTRLWERKFKARKVYTVVEIDVEVTQ